MMLSGSLGCPLSPDTFGGLRKAREELAPGVSPVLSSSRGGSSSLPGVGSTVGSPNRMVPLPHPWKILGRSL